MRAKKMWRKYGVLFHVLMPLELAEKIYELSEKMDITYSDIIRLALKEYFERLEGSEVDKMSTNSRLYYVEDKTSTNSRLYYVEDMSTNSRQKEYFEKPEDQESEHARDS